MGNKRQKARLKVVRGGQRNTAKIAEARSTLESSDGLSPLSRLLGACSETRLVYLLGAKLHARAIAGGKDSDPMVIGAARICHAMWVALRARDPMATSAMEEMERRAMSYTIHREADTMALAEAAVDGNDRRKILARDVWSGTSLPPRAGMDRHRALADLVAFTKRLVSEIVELDGVVTFLADRLETSFPQLRPRWSDEAGAVQRKALNDKLRGMLDRRAHRANGLSRVDPELIVNDALVAYGLGKNEVFAWMKGAGKELRKRHL